jgi:hypothetical protein
VVVSSPMKISPSSPLPNVHTDNFLDFAILYVELQCYGLHVWLGMVTLRPPSTDSPIHLQLGFLSSNLQLILPSVVSMSWAILWENVAMAVSLSRVEGR